MGKKKSGKLFGYAIVAGAAAAATAGICLKPSREFLLAAVKKAALLYGQARSAETGKLSGDWRGETVDVYYSFDNGILHVTDGKGFKRKDWKTGTYDLYRRSGKAADSYTIVMRCDGQSTEYAFEPVDSETIAFSRAGRRIVFKSIHY
ncbi:MAG: hypothetical protein LBQ16_05395 [Gracilibacteraceae bacterium]|jgi:hypothetical protein|nr:hypothetical protein [Gracilibacteraceae bacterium]